jgi:hypothetical protein
MGNGRDILDGANFDAGSGERAHRRFAARTWTCYPHFDGAQSAFTRLVSGGHGRLLSRKGRALTRPAKTKRPGAGPGKGVAFLIGNGDDGVVERCLDMHNARMDDALFLLLEALLLARFGCCFSLACLLLPMLLLVFLPFMSYPWPSSC